MYMWVHEEKSTKEANKRVKVGNGHKYVCMSLIMYVTDHVLCGIIRIVNVSITWICSEAQRF